MQKSHLLPPPRFETEEGRGGSGRRRPAALPGTVAAGGEGNRWRGPRGSQPRAHLELWWLEGVAPRAAGGGRLW